MGTILAIFDLRKMHPIMLPTKFRVKWPFSSGEAKKKIIKMAAIAGSHLGFPIGMILAIFDLQVTPMLPT